MHHRQLHVVGLFLAFVIGLVGRLESGDQRYLRPAALFSPGIDFFRGRFGDGDKGGISADLIPGAIKSIH
jgi:hypothetical protein